MNKKLNDVLKNLQELKYVFLEKASEQSLAEATKQLGEKMPKQLKEFLAICDGGNISNFVEFYSALKQHEGRLEEHLTFQEANSASFRKMEGIPDELVVIGKEGDGTPVGFIRGRESIFAYDRESQVASKYKNLTEYLQNTLELLIESLNEEK